MGLAVFSPVVSRRRVLRPDHRNTESRAMSTTIVAATPPSNGVREASSVSSDVLNLGLLTWRQFGGLPTKATGNRHLNRRLCGAEIVRNESRGAEAALAGLAAATVGLRDGSTAAGC